MFIDAYRTSVGAVILNDEGLVFIAERINIKNAWQFPQGGVDEGETYEEALLRELKEEIGTSDFDIINRTNDWHYYDLPKAIQIKMLSQWDKVYKGQKQLWFLCKIKPSTRIDVKTDHPEFSAFTWCSAQQALDLSVDFKKDVYKKVLEEFELL